MTTTRTFTRDKLEARDLPWALQDVEEVEQHRWYTTRKGVFEADGQHWQVRFNDPATEMQEDLDPWDDAETVTAVLVQKVPVTVERWQPVGETA